MILVHFDEDTVRPWVSRAEDFVKEISTVCIETSEPDDGPETLPS
jgi:hypothetical protein